MGHAGHAHASAGHAHASAEETLTNVSSADVITTYAGADQKLNETELLSALSLAARCLSESTCTFIASEAESAAAATGGLKHFKLKMGLTVAVFFEGLAGGMLPSLFVRTLPKMQSAFEFMNAFSGGLFLASGFVHLVPHASRARRRHASVRRRRILSPWSWSCWDFSSRSSSNASCFTRTRT